ncbi:uncharacterized protein LOC110441343 [Mizuhopecten yessoensis]|uniref:Uncharacterized protein n=1 Tax=Mizuhopecten yessoensis TaxID=6573 RepID=A0A210PJK5_MIZYE|nr:uncharacterized protein LOC110441343 [Mizuhopecten yessoensis]OWF36667.1 hypothetical protein KP79_PYT03522 [Mizuhopecten yessoensis]
MSLLFLNTRNPTWQDRTVNVEVMLAPARNQLLMNKHKTLGSKCLKAQRLYDKERESMLKNIVIEKRIMERKQQVLSRKKSDIMMNRVSSSVCSDRQISTPVLTVCSKRGGSAPAKLGWAEKNTNKPGVFLTEVAGAGELRSQSVAPAERDKQWKQSSSPSHGNLSKKAVGSASQLSMSSRRVISPFGSKRSSKRIKSVRFNDIRDHENQETDNYPSRPCVDGLVQQFVQTQAEFNQRPVTGSRNQWTKRPDTNSPLVAKRYSTLSVNNNKLINAFDNFCLDKNKEDFQKLVRLASKLKSSVKMARNQSVVPPVAALRSRKAFMEKIKKSEDTNS